MKKLLHLCFCFLLFLQASSLTFAASKLSLTDVSGHKYQPAVEYLYQKGIISGYADMTFRPDAGINRAELVKIIIESNYDEYEINGHLNTSCFPDVNANEWFAKYICFAKSKNIVEGYPDGTFKPADTINLVEALKVIYKSFKIPVKDENVVFKFRYYSPAVRAGYIPDDLIGGYIKLLTRGEVSEVIYRILIDEDRPIEESISLGLNIIKQKYRSSCGIAALATALSLQKNISEDQILEHMIAIGMYPNNPVENQNGVYYWDDPQEVFVGDYNGLVSVYLNRLSGFGFLEEPMERLAQIYAVNSEKFTNQSLGFIAEQIATGNPVIVFASVNAANGVVILDEPGPYTVNWTLKNTGINLTVPMYKHNLVIDGYRGMAGFPSYFYVIDPYYGIKMEMPASTLSSILDAYNYTGVVVKF